VEFATVKAAVSLAETPDVCSGEWARRGAAEGRGWQTGGLEMLPCHSSCGEG